MRRIVLLLFGIHLAFAEIYSLRYFYTVVSKVINIPEFTVVGLVNDQQFMYFDSNTKKAVPKTKWMKQNEREDYWDRQTQISIRRYHEYTNNMEIIMDLYNQSTSEGVHTLQVMYSCKLENDDDTTQGYYRFGYDGEDFISFNKTTLSWTAANPQAEIIKNKWDADRAKAEYWKAYLENECIEQLKKYLIYGKDSLGRKVGPQVSLLQKDSSSPLICHATGFYPKNITMTWWKNHEEHYEHVDVGFTLPNADGSYQKSISLSVPEEWKKNSDVYRCVVQHVGGGGNEIDIRTNSASGINFIHLLVIATSVLVVCVLTVFVPITLHTVRRKTRQRLKRSEAIEMDSKSDGPKEKASSLEHMADF